MRRKGVLFIVIIVIIGVSVLTIPMSTVGQNDDRTVGSPDIRILAPDIFFTPEGEDSLTVNILNTGDIEQDNGPVGSENTVTTANSVTIEADDEDLPFEVRTQEQPAGNIPRDGVSQATFAIDFPEDVEPGEYDVPITINYEYVPYVDIDGGSADRVQESITQEVTIEVEENQTTSGNPKLNLLTPDQFFTPGTEDSVSVQLQNRGQIDEDDGPIGSVDDVTTARTTTIQAVDEDLPFEVRTDEQSIGNIVRDSTTQVGFDIRIPSDVEPGEYDVPVNITYQYIPESTDAEGEPEREVETIQEEITVIVEQDQTFTTSIIDSELRPGEERLVTIEMTNTGGQDITNSVLSLTPQNNNAITQVGTGEDEESYFIDEWEEDETRQFELLVGVEENSRAESLPFSGTVDYESPDGIRESSSSVIFGIPVVGEQGFEIELDDNELESNSASSISGTITNTGSETVSNVDIGVSDDEELGDILGGDDEIITGITLDDGNTAIESLDPGETKDFELSFQTSSNVDPGDIIIPLEVEYTNQAGDRLTDGVFNVFVSVIEEGPEFGVNEVTQTVEQDGSTKYEVAVTNRMNTPVENVDARLFATEPLTVDREEAFIERLEPGETAILEFEISSSSDGLVERSYGLTLDFQYDDVNQDERVVSDTYQLTTIITESESSNTLLIIGITGFIVTLLAVGYKYQERLKKYTPKFSTGEETEEE